MINAALASARKSYSKLIEEKVCDAIDSIVSEGKTPSFYNVASRAQVARSTLYRKPELKMLVEEARDISRNQSLSNTASRCLLAENRRLRGVVLALEEKLRLATDAARRIAGASGSRMIYAIISL